jgi:ATP-dependent Clp protease adaptor protein ClpS
MPTKTETIIKIAPKTDIKPPVMFNVIYLNDNQTTLDFVVASLKAIFDHTEESALALTIKIHEEGSAVVSTLPFELAEQKGIEATMLARNNGFPLQIKLEQEQ